MVGTPSYTNAQIILVCELHHRRWKPEEIIKHPAVKAMAKPRKPFTVQSVKYILKLFRQDLNEFKARHLRQRGLPPDADAVADILKDPHAHGAGLSHHREIVSDSRGNHYLGNFPSFQPANSVQLQSRQLPAPAVPTPAGPNNAPPQHVWSPPPPQRSIPAQGFGSTQYQQQRFTPALTQQARPTQLFSPQVQQQPFSPATYTLYVPAQQVHLQASPSQHQTTITTLPPPNTLHLTSSSPSTHSEAEEDFATFLNRISNPNEPVCLNPKKRQHNEMTPSFTNSLQLPPVYNSCMTIPGILNPEENSAVKKQKYADIVGMSVSPRGDVYDSRGKNTSMQVRSANMGVLTLPRVAENEKTGEGAAGSSGV